MIEVGKGREEDFKYDGFTRFEEKNILKKVLKKS